MANYPQELVQDAVCQSHTGRIVPDIFLARICLVVADGGTWRLKWERLKAEESNDKLPPQELVQDAVCQSHTGRMTGLWFLPSPAFEAEY